MDESVKIILEDNLIDEKTFRKNPESITSIECFHFTLSAHPHFKEFPFLTEIRIIEQDVVDLDWITDCPNLQKLHVFHTKLSNTQKLNQATSLTYAMLQGNELTEFPDFSGLMHLEFIDVAKNPIAKIDSFPKLASVKTLNISGLKIQEIDDTISNMSNLEYLLVAGTDISEFHNIKSISKLKKLKKLSFSDPRYGISPICNTYNYDNILISLVPYVSTIDTISVTKKMRSIEETRRREVQLYYNSVMSSDVTFADIQCFGDTPETAQSMEKMRRDIEKFTRDAFMFEFESGGNYVFVPLSLESELLIPYQSTGEIFAAWEVQSTEQKSPSQVIGPISLSTIIESISSNVKPAIVDGESAYAIYSDDGYPVLVILYIKKFTFSDIYNSELSLILSQHSISLPLSTSLKYIQLNECSIKSLDIFKDCVDLEDLRLPNNEIAELGSLPSLQNLRILDLSMNQITSYSTTASLPSLERLTLFGNPGWSPSLDRMVSERLKPTDFFLKDGFSISNAESITVLDISGGCITSLKALNNLPQLKRLYASQNCLSSIDFSSSSLLYADFSLNHLTESPTQDRFPNLEILMMNCNGLENINPFHSLLGLFVADNQLTELPDPDQFPSLVVLHILPNPFECEPDFQRLIFQFPRLKMLNGQHVTARDATRARNAYSGILFPEQAARLVNDGQTILSLTNKSLRDVNAVFSNDLQSVDLSSNDIGEINWPRDQMRSLSQLNLSENHLSSFEFLAYLPNLSHLCLNGNKIGDAGLKLLSAVQMRVTRLELANCSLRNLEGFGAIKAVEILDLSHNFIQSISKGCFDQMNRLNTLNLSYNSLRKLDNIAIPSLVSVDCSHNRVTAVEECMKLAHCAMLKKFWFNDNPLNSRTSHRIRCLSILRTLVELDGKPVTDSDIAQVRMIIEQGMGSGIVGNSTIGQTGLISGTAGRNAKITNIVLSPQLPQLQPTKPNRKFH